MNPSSRARAKDRTLATELLRDLTILTAVVGLAATAGFGWLASMTFAGTPATGSTNDDVTTTTDDRVAPGVAKPAPNAVATPRPATGSSGSSSSGAITGGVSASRRHGHVSTGGS